MNRMQKTTRLVTILALALILVGCSTPTPTVVELPTPDISKVRTESVQTVVAKLTIEAALQPTATLPPTAAPLVITATPEPTSTPEPVIVLPTATATTKPVTGGGGVVYPTATKRSGPDLAQMISQNPIDGTNVSAGSEFDGTWTFKNIGTSTWTTGYEYRFASGTNLAKAKIYPLKESVAPGDTITLVADMVAPPQAGRYTSYWELVNENGDVFFNFFIIIYVN